MANGFQDFVSGPVPEDAGVADRLGLLASGGSPLLNLGVGLLSTNNPGEALGFSQQAGLRGQEIRATRQKLQRQAEQREARQEIQGLLSGGGEGATQQEVMGLLAKAAPEQFTQGLVNQQFGEERAEPSIVRTLRAAGIDPQSEEGQELIRQDIGGGGAQEQLDAILKRLQIEDLQSRREQAQDEQERAMLDAQFSVINSSESLREMARLNEQLANAGVLGRSGVGFDEARGAVSRGLAAVKELFGVGNQEAQQIADTVNRFEQLTTKEGIRSLFSGQTAGGQVTNDRLNAFLQTKPGFENTPDTNRLAIADMIRATLQSEEKLKDFSLADRRELERLEQTLRERAEADQQPSGTQSRSGGGAQTQPAPANDSGFRVKEIR